MDKKLIDAFAGKRVLVLGDVMLDWYIRGECVRENPEAPVPLLDYRSQDYAPGGAANAACNIVGLGGKAILVGVTGEDENKFTLIKKLQAQGIESHFTDADRQTTTKLRILAGGKYVARVDFEERKPIEARTEDRLMRSFKNQRADAMIVSDYAKGAVTPRVYAAAKEFAAVRGIPLFVDPKPKSKLDYSGATVIKFNHKEACEVMGVTQDNGTTIADIGPQLVAKYGADIVVTRADKGVSVFPRAGGMTTIDTKARQVADVSGAGDTFLAALTLASISGATLEQAVTIANHAAGIKVGKIGAVPVSQAELRKDLP
jgi:D-beta-D-heptose 7-phosphate kinase/D-beta-D-heptose 1-phosphate adenosyltransferase